MGTVPCKQMTATCCVMKAMAGFKLQNSGNTEEGISPLPNVRGWDVVWVPSQDTFAGAGGTGRFLEVAL